MNWTENHEMLSAVITKPHLGILADFDGTLSPFVLEPDQAAISIEAAQALDTLVSLDTTIALISGRGVNDLQQRFPRPWVTYYGNHGIEHWHDGEAQIASTARQWVAPIQAFVLALEGLAIPGVRVENKVVTVSVHYRIAPDPIATRQQLEHILRPLVERWQLQLSEGQFIWEVKPPIMLNKGTAAHEIIENFALESVVFLGDDVTDYTVMRRLRELRDDPDRNLLALSVGVIHPTTPPELFNLCDLTANGVEDVARLLFWIAEQRTQFAMISERGSQ